MCFVFPIAPKTLGTRFSIGNITHVATLQNISEYVSVGCRQYMSISEARTLYLSRAWLLIVSQRRPLDFLQCIFLYISLFKILVLSNTIRVQVTGAEARYIFQVLGQGWMQFAEMDRLWLLKIPYAIWQWNMLDIYIDSDIYIYFACELHHCKGIIQIHKSP